MSLQGLHSIALLARLLLILCCSKETARIISVYTSWEKSLWCEGFMKPVDFKPKLKY